MTDTSRKQERPGEKPSGWVHFDDPYNVNTAIVTFQRDEADRLQAAGFKMDPFYWTTDGQTIEGLRKELQQQRDTIKQIREAMAATLGFSAHANDELLVSYVKNTMTLIERSRDKGEL